MRLMTLNLWGGKLWPALSPFLMEQRAVDVFCFQEVFSSVTPQTIAQGMRAQLFQEIGALLPEHQGFFAATISGYDFDGPVSAPLQYGLAIFIRQTMPAMESGSALVYGQEQTVTPGEAFPLFPRIVQFVDLRVNAGGVRILNFHGHIARHGDIGDTAERLSQFQRLQNVLTQSPSPWILSGDFNVAPQTQSLDLVAAAGHNIVAAATPSRTRAAFYSGNNMVPDNIFVSPGVRARDVVVYDVAVSDHLPVSCEIDDDTL